MYSQDSRNIATQSFYNLSSVEYWNYSLLYVRRSLSRYTEWEASRNFKRCSPASRKAYSRNSIRCMIGNRRDCGRDCHNRVRLPRFCMPSGAGACRKLLHSSRAHVAGVIRYIIQFGHWPAAFWSGLLTTQPNDRQTSHRQMAYADASN
jgi:hypothetical protein